MAPVENARELVTAIADASYEELDCGHIVMAERPVEFVKLVRDVIGRPSVGFIATSAWGRGAA